MLVVLALLLLGYTALVVVLVTAAITAALTTPS